MIAKLVGCLTVAIALAGSLEALAQTPSNNLSTDDMIRGLTPGSNTAADPAAGGKPRLRGLRILSAPAGGGDAATGNTQAPAIALNVQFALNSAELTPEAKDVVKKLAMAINSDQLSSYKFKVEGHTDSTGTPDINLDLSQRRANTVREDLISEYHVTGDRLVAVGKGQSEPVDADHPDAAVNRRVQIVNLGAAPK